MFKELNSINVNGNTEKKNGLTYLSWAWAWAEFKRVAPNATYKIKMIDGKPYSYDENTGYMVFTEVTVDDLTHEMWLPVMDYNNNAMKSEPYVVKTKYKEVDVAQATMFDVNKTIMRCLTKNLAMHGLGLYIYAGEDLPEKPSKVEKTNDELFDLLREKAKSIDTEKGLTDYFGSKKVLDGLNKRGVEFKADVDRLISQRKEELNVC